GRSPPASILRTCFASNGRPNRPGEADRDMATAPARAPSGGTLAGARATPASVDPSLWYKDAILYEVHVRAFADSNADGIGDFRGLTSKLDYLQDLGITALWLLPFYPSPLRDDGYDIAQYDAIHPAYGNVRDF